MDNNENEQITKLNELLDNTEQFIEKPLPDKKKKKIRTNNNKNNIKKKDEVIETTKDPDLISNPSKNSLNEFFFLSRQDNAKRLRSQIVEIQNDASDYISHIISTMKNFENLKINLNNRYNYYIRTIFSLIGYDYDSNMPKVNFFIFATQAWILEVAKILEKRFSETKQHDNFRIITFANLLTMIKSNELPEDSFLYNLGILTSSLLSQNALTSIIIENNIGKIFLNNLYNLFKKDTTDYESLDIDKRKYDDIIFGFLRKAVENTLNIMENQFNSDNQNYINYISKYEEICREKQPSIEDLFENIKKEYSSLENNVNLYSLKISTETFFYFSMTTLDNIINDINDFYYNYSSILFRIKKIVNKSFLDIFRYNEKIFCIIRKFLNVIYDTQNIMSNMRRENLQKFYNLSNKAISISNSLITKVDYKNWIDNSLIFKEEILKFTKKFLNENHKQMFKIYLDAYISPLIDFSLANKEKINNFISTKLFLNIEEYENLKNNISKIFFTKYNDLRLSIKNLFVIENIDNTKVCFKINNSMKKLDFKIFIEIYDYINNYFNTIRNNLKARVEIVKDFSTENMNDLKNYTKNLKEYYLFQFKNLLQLKEKNN